MKKVITIILIFIAFLNKGQDIQSINNVNQLFSKAQQIDLKSNDYLFNNKILDFNLINISGKYKMLGIFQNIDFEVYFLVDKNVYKRSIKYNIYGSDYILCVFSKKVKKTVLLKFYNNYEFRRKGEVFLLSFGKNYKYVLHQKLLLDMNLNIEKYMDILWKDNDLPKNIPVETYYKIQKAENLCLLKTFSESENYLNIPLALFFDYMVQENDFNKSNDCKNIFINNG